jgi:LysR family transcriptional regulator (chromosome initiation inhibitor)
MTRLQLDQLETLVALVEVGTFDGAARRLGVSASAVSQRVKAMESSLGQIVLQRTNPVTATAAGESLLGYARQFMLLAADAAAHLGATGEAANLPIAVNADSLATWFLPALAAAQAAVDASFELIRDDQDHTADALRAGAVVAAVTSAAVPVQGCISTRLGVLRYLAVCSPDFANRHLDGRASSDSLDAAPVVLFDRKDELQDRFSGGGEASRGRRIFVPSSDEFARAVRLGIGWGMLPEQQCDEALASGELVAIAGGAPVDVELHWQVWNLRSPTLLAVTDAVVRTARDLLRQ